MLIIAHRGASGEFTEGSQAAYEAAITQKADGFECDLRLTKDNQIICYHDRNTARLSKINLEIAKTNYAQLASEINPYRFDQLLKLAIDNKKDLIIESKHPVPTGGRIERLVNKLLEKNQIAIKSSGIKITAISFSLLATIRNKSMQKDLYQSGLLINNWLYARLNPTSIFAVNINLLQQNPNLGSKIKKNGGKLYVWTVNEALDLKFCEKLGADAVITDYPAQARKALGYS
ncbi:MAG: glycerophosphodiester phosphodiesterase [Actinobacteria bacterium]|nr:glycerophosphodiester phosphodiesterase [Actinomycetota bacterium]